MVQPTNKDLLISNAGSGKEVSFAPNQLENGLMLKRAARQGYYYPMLVMKQLHALSTGLNGKRNVFIPNVNDFKANTFQQVKVYVPGIVATVERRPNDSLVVTDLFLDPDNAWQSIERGGRAKPGVYEISGTPSEPIIEYRTSGRIKPENGRGVVIADGSYSSLPKAAESASRKLELLLGRHASMRFDFDLFYSPVGAKLGGMLNYNPLVFKEAYAFSGLLADAIEQSSNQNGVAWVSELSGSIVLTQALQLLAHKSLNFAEQRHYVEMYMPTTNPLQTLKAAKKLGMIADKKMLQGNGNIRASVSCLLGNRARVTDKNDPYSSSDYAKDLASGAMIGTGAAGAIATGIGLAISSPAAPIVAQVGAAAGLIGALQVFYKAGKNRMSR